MRYALIILVGLPLTVWALYRIVYPTYTWNQKTSVVIDTPQGLIKASSTIEIVKWFGPNIIGVEGGGRLHLGEAVVADLGQGHYLFVLLGGQEVLARAMTINFPELRTMERRKFYRLIHRHYEPVEVPMSILPITVTFDDINDPTTIRLVDPLNLEKTFGAGYSLRYATVQATSDTATRGQIYEMLPCLNSGRQCVPLRDDLPYSDPLRNIMNSDFRRRERIKR